MWKKKQGYYFMLPQHSREDQLNDLMPWLCFPFGQTETSGKKQVKVTLPLTTGGSHQPIRILWTGFILPGNLENSSWAFKTWPVMQLCKQDN